MAVDAHQSGRLLVLGQGAHAGAEVGFLQHVVQYQGNRHGKGQAGQAHEGHGQEKVAFFKQPGRGGQLGGDAAAVKTEDGQPQATDDQHDTEGKDQAHEQWVAAMTTDDALDRGLDQVADAEKDHEDNGQQGKWIQTGPAVEIVPQKRAQHDPFAHGEIDDMHHPEDQRKTDGDGDVDATDENSIQNNLWQEFHMLSFLQKTQGVEAKGGAQTPPFAGKII
ncbi:hypothetical protein DESC_780283 [Desulfosarcina cetonica]|nr:hypothetical protein DESC_780283 [Desulfosarcina cetonica]